MKILPRYVLREVVVPMCLALVTLTFVLLIQMFFQRASEMTGILSLSLLARMIGYVVPTLLVLTVPMALLTGVLLGIGRLTVDSEIKAFRTHGINLFPIFAPVLVLGALAAGFSLFNSLSFAPARLKQSLTEIDRLKEAVIYALEPGRFYDDFSSKGADVVLYFEDRDPQTGILKEGYIAVEGSPKELRELTEEQDQATKYFFLAASGRIVADPAGESAENAESSAAEDGTLRDAPAARMILYNGTIHFLRGGEEAPYSVFEFQEMTISLDPKMKMLDRKTLAPTLTLGEFRETIRSLDADYFRNRPAGSVRDAAGRRLHSEKAQFFRAEFFQRLSIPLACFAFAMIGLPLSIYIRPSGKSVGITIAFLLIMAYYGIMHYGVVLTRQGVGLGPLFGPYVIFLPNVVLTLLGGVLLYRTVHR